MTLEIYQNIHELPADYWQQVPDFYLKKPYLNALAQSLPPNLQPYYVVGRAEGVFVFGAYLQLYTFEKSELDSLQTTGFLATRVGKMLAKRFYAQKYKVLVVGNALHTGNHSYWHSGGLDIDIIIEKIAEVCKKNVHFDAIVYKDIAALHTENKNLLLLPTEPNMVLTLPTHWQTKEDYIQDLSAKYRTRYKSAIKKMEGIQIKNLDLDALQVYKMPMATLFENVFVQGDFKVAKIKDNYFVDFKTTFQDDFVVLGYFVGDALVGFISGFLQKKHQLDANYIGIDYNYNTTHKLYQNMLYDYVRWGIEAGVNKINFSRTALAIKSTLGAEPQVLCCYIGFENCLAQAVFTPIIRRLHTTTFEQRNPFKTAIV